MHLIDVNSNSIHSFFRFIIQLGNFEAMRLVTHASVSEPDTPQSTIVVNRDESSKPSSGESWREKRKRRGKPSPKRGLMHYAIKFMKQLASQSAVQPHPPQLTDEDTFGNMF